MNGGEVFGSIGLPELIVLFVVLGGGIPVYFLPTIVAVSRKMKNIAPIVIVNLLLGWTVIGWIVAFWWAILAEGIHAPPVPPAIVVQPAVQPPPRQADVPTGKLCLHCGKYSQPDARLCASCGQAFS